MPRGKRQPWPGVKGGYLLGGVYAVRRSIAGRPFDVSLRRTTAAAALQELQRWEADPLNWTPLSAELRTVTVDDDLVLEFLVWSRDEKKNTAEWRYEQKRVLAWWGDELAGVDLQKRAGYDPLVLHIQPALKKAGSRSLAIRVLKTFCAWLRFEKHLLDLSSDPVAGRLRAAPARPAQWKKSRVISAEHIATATKHLAPLYRDALEVLLGTGWHVTELARFASAGDVDQVPEGREGEGTAVLVTPRTKLGNSLRTLVSAPVEAAARRLRARGELSKKQLRRAIESACSAGEIDVFTPGSFRHTVSTFAKNHGAHPKSIGDFLNHQSEETNRRFYSTHAVPAKVPTPR